MERAKKRAAWKNLDPEGKPLSFRSLPYHFILDFVARIGVNLGSNSKQISDSVNCLTLLEQQRYKSNIVSKVNCLMDNSDLQCEFSENKDEEEDDFDNLTLGHLCGD